MNKKEKQTHRYREQTAGCQIGLGHWVKKRKRLGSTNWSLQNGHEDVKHSIGNIVNNIIITMHGLRWVLDLLGGTLHKLYKCLTTTLKIM